MTTPASYVCPHGLACVVRRASDHPHVFLGWTRGHCCDVEELPVGAYVLVLPSRISDLGWTPVVHREKREARFVWVHPETLRPVCHLSDGGIIRIGHFAARSRSPATYLLPFVGPGVKIDGGTVILDARWEGFGACGRSTCTGHCIGVCCDMCSDASRMGDILDFASRTVSGVVACTRGTHRSVAAGHILEICFGREIDWTHATTRPCSCGRLATTHADELWQALRELPRRTASERRSLATCLRLRR